MQTGKLFVRDRNARAIFCIGFFAAQHPVKDVLPCTENRFIVHRIGDNGSLTVNPPATLVVGGFTRDFRMMQGRLHFLRNPTLEKLRSFWWKSTSHICGVSCEAEHQRQQPLRLYKIMRSFASCGWAFFFCQKAKTKHNKNLAHLCELDIIALIR